MKELKQSILIVDDNAINIQVLNEIFNSIYTIFFATNGLDALRVAESKKIDLILLDVMMPQMDGYEVCRRLKENSELCEIPVIFVTAMAEVTDETQGLELGAVDYITKPVSAPIVKARVKNHLQLVQKARALQEAYGELKASQSQLLQQEKMASLGQLADGIAHEINTPCQYLNSNLEFLLDVFNDFDTLIDKQIDLLSAAENKQPLEDMIDEVKKTIEDIDYSYLSDEIPSALAQSQQGLGRIQEIVAAMKEFSCAGAEDRSLIDLNKVIRSTVEVSRSIWSNSADLLMELDENLPMVALIPGEFNQVVLNTIVNAAQAVDEAIGGSNARGTISITSNTTTDGVEINISDSGIGIASENIDRIFEPFFTTREVGNGAGLGLSIAYDIIKKNGGNLYAESSQGKGTNIFITFQSAS